MRALEVAAAARERLGHSRRHLVVAERAGEPLRRPDVMDADLAGVPRVLVAPRPADAAEVEEAVGLRPRERAVGQLGEPAQHARGLVAIALPRGLDGLVKSPGRPLERIA